MKLDGLFEKLGKFAVNQIKKLLLSVSQTRLLKRAFLVAYGALLEWKFTPLYLINMTITKLLCSLDETVELTRHVEIFF